MGVDYGFKFREYDSRMGKFFSIDPLTQNYPFWSPYAFAGNSPIAAVDLEGNELLPVNSAIYRMRHLGSSPVVLISGNSATNVTSSSYAVDIVLMNVPDALKNNRGTIGFNLGPNVGTKGEDVAGPYMDPRPKIPDWLGGPAAPNDGEQTASSKGNMIPGNDDIQEQTSGMVNIPQLANDQTNRNNADVWNASSVEKNSRRQFYIASGVVKDAYENVSSVFKQGQARADIINLIADGTLPNMDKVWSGSKSSIEHQSRYLLNLMDEGFKLATKNGIVVRQQMYDKYRAVSKINKDNGGSGGSGTGWGAGANLSDH